MKIRIDFSRTGIRGHVDTTPVIPEILGYPLKILLRCRIGMKFGTKVEGVLKKCGLYDRADIDHVIISIIDKNTIFCKSAAVRQGYSFWDRS